MSKNPNQLNPNKLRRAAIATVSGALLLPAAAQADFESAASAIRHDEGKKVLVAEPLRHQQDRQHPLHGKVKLPKQSKAKVNLALANGGTEVDFGVSAKSANNLEGGFDQLTSDVTIEARLKRNGKMKWVNVTKHSLDVENSSEVAAFTPGQPMGAKEIGFTHTTMISDEDGGRLAQLDEAAVPLRLHARSHNGIVDVTSRVPNGEFVYAAGQVPEQQ